MTLLGLLAPLCLLQAAPPRATTDTESAQQVTMRFVDAMRASDWKKVATLMHPAALHDLRGFFSVLLDAPNADPMRRELLGVSSAAEAKAMSDTAMFEALLRFSAKSPELGDAFRAAKVQILGEIKEGPDTTHVVYRMHMTLEGTPVSTMDVFSLARSPAGWRGLLKGDMAAFAAAIRTAIQREGGGAGPP